MKKFIQFASAALLFGALALSAQAVTVTNADGTTFTVTTLEEVAAGVRSASIQEDQSKIPHQDDRVGHISFTYSVAREGGTGVVDIGPQLPVGTAVRGGFVQTTTAVLPVTATSAVHVVSANDLLTAGRNMQSTGITMLNVASGNYVSGSTTNTLITLKAPIVTTANARQVKLTWSGSTATQGVFQIHLDLVKVQ